MSVIGGIEALGPDPRERQRIERRIADEGLSHLRLLVSPEAWAGEDDALLGAVDRLARRVGLVVACDVGPPQLWARLERLHALVGLLAEHDGALELPADPRTSSIWVQPSPAPALAGVLAGVAQRAHDEACTVAWRIAADTFDLEGLARHGPWCKGEPIVVDVGGCDTATAAAALRRAAACWPQAPLWLCAGSRGPVAADADVDAGSEVQELERFVEAVELPSAERVYWSGRPQAPLRSLWGRMGQPRATSLLVRRPGPRVTIPRPSRVLVTGGAGFVGCNLVSRLRAEGRHVVVLDNLSRPGVERNLEWLRRLPGGSLEIVAGDVRSPTALQRALQGVELVYHLAAQVAVTTSLEDPVADFEINAGGTLRLLEALRRRPSPPGVVLTSTNKVYGGLYDVALEEGKRRYAPTCPHVRERGINEARALDLHSPYGCSKGAADQYVLDYSRSFGVPAVVFRMSCIYGPRQLGTEDQGWVAHFLRQALQGLPITIYGDGKQVRDVLFVEDLCDALVAVGQRVRPLRGHAFNVGGGPRNTLSLLELIDHLEVLLGRRPRVRFGPWRQGDQRYYVSDTSSLAEAVEWKPRVDVAEGLLRLHDWLCEVEGAAASGADRSCAS